jgi:hypothetical protein
LIASFNQLHGYQAISSTYHTTLQATPCQLVFGRDMIHNIVLRSNWNRIQKQKQDIINKYNQKENKKNSWIPYEYKVGNQALLETPGILRKLSKPRTGPCLFHFCHKFEWYKFSDAWLLIFVNKWEIWHILPITKVTCLNHVTSMFDKTRHNESNFWVMLHPCLTNKIQWFKYFT